ncbi:hypothetical protein [Streptomyces sp. NPDC017529]|uniref:hypothetical protein n=1 Tax=Streptomyces sp. NPDC017529 TaxID=3365000 RepID=UPI00379F2683
MPDEDLRQKICTWLTANGIDPKNVAPAPIYVLSVPHLHTTISGEEAWMLDVIVFTEQYRNSDGTREINFLTDEPVTCQRTVPLRYPWESAPTGRTNTVNPGDPA